MPHPSWKGYIRLSLVSVPVVGYEASAKRESQIELNQLHEGCGERIRYKKTCPIHGEVQLDEIVKGYQYEKDQYVVVHPDELEQLRSEADRSINISRFVDAGEIDPTYFSGRTYYLLPNGKPGEKPYAVLQRAMGEANVVGLAQVVITNREQLVALRPMGKLLTASVLHFAADLKPLADLEGMLPEQAVSREELKLAKTLIETTHEDTADMEGFHDLYAERLREIVNAKIAGQEIVPQPEGKGPPVFNLMDALKASLNYRETRASTKKEVQGAKSGRTRRSSTPKKRKTG